MTQAGNTTLGSSSETTKPVETPSLAVAFVGFITSTTLTATIMVLLSAI